MDPTTTGTPAAGARRSPPPELDWRDPVASLGQLARPTRTLPATTRFLELERLFLDDRTLSSIVVYGAHGEPIGVTRERFFAQLAGNLGFGRALYSRHSVEETRLPPTLVLPAVMSVAEATAAILRRPRRQRYDDLVVRFDNGSLATACAGDLFAALSDAHAYDALHDGLTGLPNRRLFLSRLDAAQADLSQGGDGAAVLFVDIDDFKTINDGFGHDTGNDVLCAVAGRLRGTIRFEDTVARLSGDEFAVLVRGVGWRADATALAERVVATLAERVVATLAAPVRVGDHAVSVSVGAALEMPGGSGELLLRNADLAMYAVKRRGKGQHALYGPALHTQALTRLELRTSLERALDRDELALAYQPIVELRGAAIVGVEALLRWHPAGRHAVLPAEFIPLSEETGLIVPIGRWVLQEACRQAKDWVRARPDRAPLGLAVNISPRQIQDPAIVDYVSEALADSDLDPGALTLEITEGVFMHDMDTAIERLHTFKRLGIRLALDDFGVGYSSLGYLSRMPIDLLKLDKAFISSLSEEKERRLVAGIIQLARTLGIDTVAEGVEHADQVRDLQAMGCAFAQGYLFARPLDVDTVTLLVEAAVDRAVPAWPPGPNVDGPSDEPGQRGADGLVRLDVAGRQVSGEPRVPDRGQGL